MRVYSKNRRAFVISSLTALVGLFSLGAGYFLRRIFRNKELEPQKRDLTMIKQSFPLGLHYTTFEPFLFCAHHFDHYPKGNTELGPDPSLLNGRNIGMDFESKDGFRMYHGETIPGFPVHPHRGFETITIVRQGFVDHSDSLGAAGRYGNGDIQWLTAGSGIQHSEMFPLLHNDRENTCELFQIWLNLPKRNKMAAPHYKMYWAEEIPRAVIDDGKVTVTLIAGQFDDLTPLQPPPESWAMDKNNEVTVLIAKLKKGGTFRLPKSLTSVNRALYFFAGSGLEINGEPVPDSHGFEIDPSQDLSVYARGEEAEILILQGKPIGEPIVQQGPFVMNSRAEIIETIRAYQQTQFGGWPWPRPDMVHGSAVERFAKHPDGKTEKRKMNT